MSPCLALRPGKGRKHHLPSCPLSGLFLVSPGSPGATEHTVTEHPPCSMGPACPRGDLGRLAASGCCGTHHSSQEPPAGPTVDVWVMCSEGRKARGGRRPGRGGRAGGGAPRPAHPGHRGCRARPRASGSLRSSRRCAKDDTYRPYSPPAPRVARFQFSAFHFLRRFPAVYLRCRAVVCRAYDYSSRCYRGCVARAKRDAGSFQQKVDVVVGPIRLRAPHADRRSLGRWPSSLPAARRGPGARAQRSGSSGWCHVSPELGTYCVPGVLCYARPRGLHPDLAPAFFLGLLVDEDPEVGFG